jgi:transcriptional regulator with XRE-family HTH domain
VSNENVRDARLADGIGHALRQVRIAAGLNNKEFAARMDKKYSSRVSNLENGKVEPSASDIEAWAQAADLDAAATKRLYDIFAEYEEWKADLHTRMRYGVAGHELDYTGTFKATKIIRTFAAFELPGYLQIPKYAHASVALSAPDAPEDERAEAVNARIERGKYLDGRRQFEIVVAESVLRWLICEPEVMRMQLLALSDLAKEDHVDLRVLPMGRRLEVVPRESFTIHDNRFVMVDLYGGPARFRQRDAKQYASVMEALMDSAVQGAEVRALLDAAVAALPSR